MERNPLTAKGHKRKKIAHWAILAQWPDCSGGLQKVHKELKHKFLTLCPLRLLCVLCG
jgi:hypothetical protein